MTQGSIAVDWKALWPIRHFIGPSMLLGLSAVFATSRGVLDPLTAGIGIGVIGLLVLSMSVLAINTTQEVK